MGERRHDQRVRLHQGHDPGGVQTRHGSLLPGLHQRHARGAEAHAAARPRAHRAGGQRAGLPGHPAPGGVLREQARHPGFHGQPPGRVDPRQEQRHRVHGADARAQHPAVRLVQEQECPTSRSRSRRSTSRKSPPRPSCSRPRIRGARSTWACRRSSPSWATSCFPRLGDWYLGKTGVAGQQTKQKADPNAPNNLYEPVGGDPGAHGRFDKRAYKSSAQLWTDLHRDWMVGGLLAVVVGVAGSFLAANRTKSR